MGCREYHKEREGLSKAKGDMGRRGNELAVMVVRKGKRKWCHARDGVGSKTE